MTLKSFPENCSKKRDFEQALRPLATGLLGLLTTLMVAVPLTLAQAPPIPKPDFLPGPKEDATSQEVQRYLRNQAIPGFTAGFIALVGGLSIIVLVWSGIRFITAQGEEEAITNAKKTAVWAVAGFGIAILSYAIVATITSLNLPDEQGGVEGSEQPDIIYRDN